MPTLSKVEVANLAIARLPAKPISSWNETSLEAREVRRFYPQVISDMLEGPHDFSFAITRVALAAIANDRDGEWVTAYALPANMGSAIRVIPDFAALGLAIPVPLGGDPYMETWALNGRYLEAPYIISGSTLYTNISDASLEYQVSDVDSIALPSLVVKAIELDLAARLAVPVKKDSGRERELMAMAEVAWSRAIADDRNRQPEQSGQYLSEAMLARGSTIS